MKEVTGYLIIFALALVLLFIKQSDDRALLQSKDETIKALQAAIQVRDESIARHDPTSPYHLPIPGPINPPSPVGNDEDADSNDIFPKDNGFEGQDLGSGFFAYQYFGPYVLNPNHVPEPTPIPNRTPWKFGGAAGIAANNSGFYVSNATNRNSDGVKSTNGQAAFLSIDDSSISQSIKIPSGKYVIIFGYEARRDYRANKIAVFIDSTRLFVGTPTDTEHFTRVVTKPITFKSNGEHVLMFRGLGGPEELSGDSFIDDIRIHAVSSSDEGADSTVGNNTNQLGSVASALK